MGLPKKISPCPILESIAEIRFDSKVPSEAIFGVIYTGIKDEFPGEVANLPVLQLPEAIRAHDKDLKYQPYYRLKHENYILSIGPKVISLACVDPYAGWEAFSEKIKGLINNVLKSGVIEKIERIGLRYINFFESNIFDSVDMNISIGKNSLSQSNLLVKTGYSVDEYAVLTQIFNSAMTDKQGVAVSGSIVDVDVSREDIDYSDCESLFEFLNSAHTIEKKVFFELLSEEFIATLNPEY